MDLKLTNRTEVQIMVLIQTKYFYFLLFYVQVCRLTLNMDLKLTILFNTLSHTWESHALWYTPVSQRIQITYRTAVVKPVLKHHACRSFTVVKLWIAQRESQVVQL